MELLATDVSEFQQRYCTHFVAGYVEQSSISITNIMRSYTLVAPKVSALRDTCVVGPDLKNAAIKALEAQRQCRAVSFRGA